MEEAGEQQAALAPVVAEGLVVGAGLHHPELLWVQVAEAPQRVGEAARIVASWGRRVL
jgi:hypothetical protein